MGRRGSKDGREVMAPMELDSVGVTILPGHPLPVWAGGEEAGAPPEAMAAPEAWPTPTAWDAADWGASDDASAAAAMAVAGAPEQAPAGAGWPADAAAASYPAEPQPAMVGVGAPAWAAAEAASAAPAPSMPGATAPTATGASTYPPPAFGAAGYPSRAGVSGPVTAPAGAGLGGPGTMPGYPGGAGVGGPPFSAAAGPAFAGPGAMPGAATTLVGGQPPTTLPSPREAHAPAMTAAGSAATAWPGAPAAPAPTGPAPGFPGPGFPGPGSPAAGSPAPGFPAPGGHGPAGPAVAAQAPVAPALVPPGMPAASPAPAAGPSVPAAPSQASVPPDASPSDVWTSQQRPELSPEHVALLTWWADMISKGQFPGPVPAAAAPPASGKQGRRARGRRGASASAPAAPVDAAGVPVAATAPSGSAPQSAARQDSPPAGRRRLLIGVAAGVCGVALVGAALVVGPMVLGAGAATPAPVPVTDLVMPAAVGDLVPLDPATAGESLSPVLGLALRPRGVTVTQAYGATPDGPMVLAALASTAPNRSDAVGQILSWEQANGAKVGESVAGTGTSAGITCAPVSELPAAPAGSICIWGDQVLRGQTYAVGADPQAAMELTAQLRSGVTPATQP